MSKEQFFSVAIRVVFLFAFGAFLFASIHHIATFFDNFEQDSGNWFGSYALAISIDATALVLTIGVMFFRHNMPWYAQVFVWFFIIGLTAFSWLVNWEYALRFQSDMLTTNDTLKMINPILASSFAFLNLAYSLVSEFFSARVQTSGDLEAEAARLESLIDAQNRINEAKKQLQKPSLIQRAKGVVMEVKDAANEVITSGDIVPEIEEELPEYKDDIPEDNTPIVEPEEHMFAPLRRDDLGMIEGVMYDKVMEDETILFELLNEANMSSISELTLSLQRRFSSHANYITESRVRNVFEAIKADHPQVISAPNENNMEPDTDPEIETISPSNDIQAEDDNDAPEPANITNISSVKKSRITQDLNPDMQSKRGAYAITKQAAAELLRCPISEIERGIMAGEIKPFAKDMDKVLRTSLEGFVPQKRSRKATKVAAK